MASLKEGKWSCYRGGQFKGDRMVMLQRWFMEGVVTEVARLREYGHVTEVDHFKEGIMVILQRWPV